MDRSGYEVQSKVGSNGELKLWLERCDVGQPRRGEVLVQVEASPINPSDIGVLLGPADLDTLSTAGEGPERVVRATVAPASLPPIQGRVDLALPVGNEGAGVVIAAGEDAQELVGRTVATRTPGMWSQYRVARVSDCLVLPAGVAAWEGAAAFINPLTALGMTETLRREGHGALVHTAAASNLGQMLIRICRADGIPLVNIVRSPAQVATLRELGADYVIDSSAPSFIDDLDSAIRETRATLAFDAIGGGTMAGTILGSMERALSAGASEYNRYGSPVHKQVYIYGTLDPGQVELVRTFGMAWGVGGWLVTWFMERIGPEASARMRARVAAELTTTFKSSFTREIALADVLSVEAIRGYTRRATGEKYLITPHAA